MHEGCTGWNTSTVWVSVPPSVDGASVKSICLWPWLKGTNGANADLVSNGALGWGSICGFYACVYACVFTYIHVLDPVLQLMVFMCVLVWSCGRSQVWVTERLESEQVAYGGEKKSVKVLTNQKHSCDMSSHPYVSPTFHTCLLKSKNKETISRS